MPETLYANYFVKDAKDYLRDLDMFKHYVQDSSKYLQLSTGKPLEVCKAFVLNSLKKGGRFEFTDPALQYLDREENGDRIQKTTTLNAYLKDSLRKQELIAPTLTTYVNPKYKKSVLSRFIENNIAGRNKAKKEMFSAESAKDHQLYAVKKTEQTGKKLDNNAISGGHVTPSTPIYNKTAHSTLTSTCRTTSGYGNANNEKFLSGNRHYYNHHVTLNNIMALVNSTNYDKLQEVITKYNIHYPTIEDTVMCIRYSATMYWWDRVSFAKIERLIEKLSPLQRSAVVYVGDAHHLLKHNQTLMRTLLTKLSDKVVGQHDNPMRPLRNAPDSYINLAHQICYVETLGIGKDYSRIAETPAIHTLALTVENIATTVVAYKDLIAALWMPETVPASVAYFPESIRRSAITSDTDSTIFTVQDWVLWYCGGISFDTRAKGVYAAIVFLASSTITHLLATMSANLGISEDHMFKIKMKSEFSFDVFIPTQLGKHYFAAISCQEGHVKDELEYEIKGAQLKSANAPRIIIAKAMDMMKRIIAEAMGGKSISLMAYIKEVADVEREIERSIRSGELTYLRSGSIKEAESYTKEENDSPFANHHFWKRVWADKYGHVPEPPYSTNKIPVTTLTATKLKVWVANIKDTSLRSRLISYLGSAEKTTVGTFHVPLDVLSSKGIPEEIMEIFDFERFLSDICRIFYILLETIGYYALGNKTCKLVSRNGF